ncbi:MAG: hypothetical protein PHZ28_03765 [Candidatus Izemoplasmatales bacterium]|nr:hypothetical protein [Candidatus Izemoplasmatales bacterium]
MTQELRERKLRQEIHALRVRKFHWPVEGFKFIMNGLGFGESLRALPEERLLELKSIMINYRKHGRPYEFTYDKQGRYMFSLMKQANWTDNDLRAYLLIHYRKSHWNLLTKKERRAVIAMFQYYVKKQTNKDHKENPHG